MRIVMMIFYLTLILIGVSFAALNATSVQVNFYVTTLKMPISVLMTMMVGLGVSIGFILFLCRYWRLKVEHRRIKNQLKLTEREIKNLRTIPLRNEDTAF
ncbi:MAG: LapA family protein [Legionellaceae bacterium]|nr:LapA family protein [Legionellaceae bacterium]